MKPPTEDNIRWATECLSIFDGWPGQPTNPNATRAIVESFLRIVQDRPVIDIVRDARPDFPEDEDDKNWLREHFSAWPDYNPTDTEWLLKEATNRYQRYPFPAALRVIYQDLFLPADGKRYLPVQMDI